MRRIGWIIAGSVAALWLLTSITFPGSRQIGRGNVATAKSQLHAFADALENYRSDIGAYPKSDEGLEALMVLPGNLKRRKKWKGQYLPDATRIPEDPWGNEYLYESDAAGRSCRVTSLGADGRTGGKGDDADVRLSLPR